MLYNHNVSFIGTLLTAGAMFHVTLLQFKYSGTFLAPLCSEVEMTTTPPGHSLIIYVKLKLRSGGKCAESSSIVIRQLNLIKALRF